MNYDFEKKEAETKADQEKKDAIAREEKRSQTIITHCIGAVLAMVALFAFFIYRSYLEKRKANAEISFQKKIIEEKQKDILDSIRYARRIQKSLMPTEKYIDKTLNKFRS